MKEIYVCETCGLRFDKKEDCLACEQKHEDERNRKEKLEAEKDERAKEIEKARTEYQKLLRDYIKDYGYYVSESYANVFRDWTDKYFS